MSEKQRRRSRKFSISNWRLAPSSACYSVPLGRSQLSGRSAHLPLEEAITNAIPCSQSAKTVLTWALLSLACAMPSGPQGVSVVSKVLVNTDRQEYQEREELEVTVTNDLDTRITTYDQRAFCTIIGLEISRAGQWEEIRNCFVGAPPQTVTLEPHSKSILKLPGLAAGFYRAVVSFSLGATFDLGRSQVAYSTAFSVK